MGNLEEHPLCGWVFENLLLWGFLGLEIESTALTDVSLLVLGLPTVCFLRRFTCEGDPYVSEFANCLYSEMLFQERRRTPRSLV